MLLHFFCERLEILAYNLILNLKIQSVRYSQKLTATKACDIVHKTPLARQEQTFLFHHSRTRHRETPLRWYPHYVCGSRLPHDILQSAASVEQASKTIRSMSRTSSENSPTTAVEQVLGDVKEMLRRCSGIAGR